MKTFSYIIKNELGIHARPAGMLVKTAKGFESAITLETGGKTASATKLIAVMTLGAKRGDVVTVTVEGADEENAAAEMERFFGENF